MPQTRKHDKRSRSGTPSTQNPDMVESVGVQSFKQKPIEKRLSILMIKYFIYIQCTLIMHHLMMDNY